MCFSLQDLHGENREHKLRPSTAADIQHSARAYHVARGLHSQREGKIQELIKQWINSCSWDPLHTQAFKNKSSSTCSQNYWQFFTRCLLSSLINQEILSQVITIFTAMQRRKLSLTKSHSEKSTTSRWSLTLQRQDVILFLPCFKQHSWQPLPQITEP